MAKIDVEYLRKKFQGAIDKSAIALAREIAEIEREMIFEHVYEYYDDIRSGANVTNKYERSFKLLDKIEVAHMGHGQIAIRNKSHTHKIRENIREGKIGWKRSIIYSLSPSQRKRDYIGETMKILKKTDIAKLTRVELHRNGIKTIKKR